ncbi:MAG: TolC family protein [Thermodesulfobacteriota bacterium]|nr:TolC family protein [Thermodesulfobacteriota bacterium]
METAESPELGLNDFVELALQNNPEIIVARNQVWAAEGRTTQAVSGYLPQLTAYGEAGRMHINDLQPEDEDNVLSGGISARQLIYDFGKTSGLIAASNHETEAAIAYLNTVGSDIVYQVKAAYYDVLAKHYLIIVASDQVNSYTMHYNRASEYYKAGVKSKIDVTNAQVELSKSDLFLLQSQFALKSSKVALNRVVGLAPENGNYLIQMDDHDPADFGTLLSPIPASLNELLQKAADQRPDLTRAERTIDSAESILTVAESGYWPEIGAMGSYNTYDTELATLNDQWQVGIGLDWEFFSGFRTKGEVTEAKSNLRSTRAQLRDIQLNAIQEVTDSFHRAEEKRESVFLAEKITKLAKENLDLADERYKTGLGDMIEFNDAQIRYTDAQNNLVTTFFDYNTALANLENATGFFPDMSLPETKE